MGVEAVVSAVGDVTDMVWWSGVEGRGGGAAASTSGVDGRGGDTGPERGPLPLEMLSIAGVRGAGEGEERRWDSGEEGSMRVEGTKNGGAEGKRTSDGRTGRGDGGAGVRSGWDAVLPDAVARRMHFTRSRASCLGRVQ